MTAEQLYSILCNSPGDINEHLPTIRRYCQECEHITEFGTRYGTVTVAMIVANPKKIITYDIMNFFESTKKMYSDFVKDINFNFILANDLEIEIEETDLLFIDTLHTYNQLYKELTKHASKVKRYILMHDTEYFGEKDEATYTGEEIRSEKFGLINAYEDFLKTKEGNNWFVFEIYKNNNGLTILKRKENGTN